MKKEIGIIISLFRNARSLKQDYMAYKIGISPSAYANIERGRSDANTMKLDMIAKLLGIKYYQIIVLAEEIRDNGGMDGLPEAISGIVRLTKINQQTEQLTSGDEFLLSMDKAVRTSAYLKTTDPGF